MPKILSLGVLGLFFLLIVRTRPALSTTGSSPLESLRNLTAFHRHCVISLFSLQSLMKECTERKSSLGKDFQLDLQKLRMRLEGDKKGEMHHNSHSPSHITQDSQIPGTKAEDQLLLFLTKSKSRNLSDL